MISIELSQLRHPAKLPRRGVIQLALHVGVMIGLAAAMVETGSAEPINKLLIVGNSITLHKPYARIGWAGSWGMAASAQEKDYSHILASMLENAQNGKKPILSLHTVYGFEQNTDNFNFNQLDFVANFRPDTVVVFLGDNVALESFPAQQFQRQFRKLLATLGGRNAIKLYCVSTWWGNRAVDRIISKECNTQNGKFIDIRGMSELPGMKATSSERFWHKGVAAHPSDEGMDAIARAILSSMKDSISDPDVH